MKKVVNESAMTEMICILWKDFYWKKLISFLNFKGSSTNDTFR